METEINNLDNATAIVHTYCAALSRVVKNMKNVSGNRSHNCAAIKERKNSIYENEGGGRKEALKEDVTRREF